MVNRTGKPRYLWRRRHQVTHIAFIAFAAAALILATDDVPPNRADVAIGTKGLA